MRRLASALALTGSALACEALIGADFDDVVARPTDSGSSCDSRRPALPPDIEGGGSTAFLVVLHDVDLGDGEATDGTPRYLEVGYDVDATCTNRGDAPRCGPAAWTEGDPTDGPQGQDNGVGKLLFLQEQLFGLSVVSSSVVNTNIAGGGFPPLAVVSVEGYNGFSEDDVVTVRWYVPIAAKLDPTGEFVPKLDGTDAWPLASRASVQGTGSATTAMALDAKEAYVNGRTLVARFDSAPIPLANVYFDGRDVVLTAKIVFDPATQTTLLSDGLVAGHSPADSLLEVIPRITAEFLGVPLCTDDPSYTNTKKFICSGADVATGAHTKGAPCDGTSFGIAFESSGVSLGAVGSLPEPKAKCPAATDPAADTCTE